MRPLDLAGKKFGLLTVLERVFPNTKRNNTMWKCLCDCGNVVDIQGNKLTAGERDSCGCTRNVYVEHGCCKGGKSTREYSMFQKANERAKKYNIPFNLSLDDIVIPEFCPVFPSIKLSKENKKQSFDSPTLDRLVTSLGYVKGNVRVISWRANDVKGNASYEELITVANWIKGELKCREQMSIYKAGEN